jgi:hypothetical protein
MVSLDASAQTADQHFLLCGQDFTSGMVTLGILGSMRLMHRSPSLHGVFKVSLARNETAGKSDCL